MLLLVTMAKLGVTPSWLHLHFDSENYFAQAARFPGLSDGTAFQAWSWGGTGGVGTVETDYVLVYDASDEIALPQSQRSSAWAKRHEQWQRMDSGIDSVEVTRIDGHFFLLKREYD